MFTVIHSCALSGIDAVPVSIEVDISNGLPGFTLVGLADSAVKESRERVFSALKNSGFKIPSKRITINLAPGGIKKEGTAFDLPIAIALLIGSEQIQLPLMQKLLFLGELSLDGGVRPVRGILSAAIYAQKMGFTGIVIPNANKLEAEQVEPLGIFSPANLLECITFLRNGKWSPRIPEPQNLESTTFYGAHETLDFNEVRGQSMAKRALEVAAAGAHNVLLVGSPGCGKTLLARRLPSILPQLSREESLETTRIYSAAGLLKLGQGSMPTRPFRAPHHSISQQALIGGGSMSRPGEVSLAHNGVLFLDELPEFRRDAIESLREPLEEGKITISRTAQTMSYPSRTMLAAAMNPCPCGFLLDRKRRCLCRTEEIVRYRSRISGPMLDRIDIHLELPVLGIKELDDASVGESSLQIRERVTAARNLQRERYQNLNLGSAAKIFCNSHLSGIQARENCVLTSDAKKLLGEAVESIGFSARAYDRIIKISRTIADLEQSEKIEASHIAEGIHYRCMDREIDHLALI